MNLPPFKLPPFKRALPPLTLAVIAAVLIGFQYFDALYFATSRYERCAKLVNSDPAQALILAQSWRAEKPNLVLAQHCEALALFATQDYADAGAEFLRLAQQVTVTDTALSAQLFLQAGRAFAQAGQPDKAKEAAGAALTLQPGNEEIKALLADIAREK